MLEHGPGVFFRRRDNGSFHVICLVCFATIADQVQETKSVNVAMDHVCDAGLVSRLAQHAKEKDNHTG